MFNVKPPWTRLGRHLESTVRKALYDFKLLEGEEKVAIALSGGKDSLSLLFLLSAISGRGFPKWELHAIHVSGTQSCGAGLSLDQLEEICASHGVILHHCPMSKEYQECYSCSRERRALLFREARKHQIRTIAFGHHRDDSIQTLLMNCLHKGEFAAMLPKLEMYDYGVTLIRPLIYVTEQELRTFSQHYGFGRVVCQCPYGKQTMRRQVDLVLSEMERLYPNARANLARAALIYGSDKAKRK